MAEAAAPTQDVKAIVTEQARAYHAANLPLDRAGKSASNVHAKADCVASACRAIAAETVEVEDELVGIFHA